jgi:hypothetical protein
VTRSLVSAPESSYGLHVSDDIDRDQVRDAAQKLLSKDSYHFGRTASVRTVYQLDFIPQATAIFTVCQGGVDCAAPYQHLEMFASLAHFFKGRDAVGIMYKDQFQTGVHGIQIPDAMVALTATAVSLCYSHHTADTNPS